MIDNDNTVIDTELTVDDKIEALTNSISQMAKNQVTLLHHVAALQDRLEVLEKRATRPKLHGLN